jgi:F-type H+-transporting ATPase subunit beta
MAPEPGHPLEIEGVLNPAAVRGPDVRHGAVASVRGSVVDVRFDDHLPPIRSLLHAKEGAIVIEVLAQLDAHHVRGIALTPTQGLARGMTVVDTGGPLKAPVGKDIRSRMFDVFGNAIDRQARHRRGPLRRRRRLRSAIGREDASGHGLNP